MMFIGTEWSEVSQLVWIYLRHRRKMQTSTTLAECKEKVTSEVSPTLVLSSMSSMQSEDSKQQDDIGVIENNEDSTEKAVVQNNNDITETGVMESNKDTFETGGMENNEDATDTRVVESNIGTTKTGIIESHKGTTEAGVIESHKGTTETGVMESHKGTTETGVMENNEGTTETEVENFETEKDASLVTSFSNMAVSDQTSVGNQKMKTEDNFESNENTDQKLLMVNDKEKSKFQEGDNKSVHGCNNFLVDHDLRRIRENEQKPIAAETGAIPKTKMHDTKHNANTSVSSTSLPDSVVDNESNTIQNQKKNLNVKKTEALDDSGIVIDGEASEATIPKVTSKDLPDLLTQLGHSQSDKTENIPIYKSKAVPKGISEAPSTDFSGKGEVRRRNTEEIFNENDRDTVDHQLQYTQQMSTVSMDEGSQDDMEKVQQKLLQEAQQQALQKLTEPREQQQYEQGQQHLLMKNLKEYPIQSDSSQATIQSSAQNFSRFDSSTSHSEVYRGGDGGVNVFPGGQLNVGTLSVNPSPQSGLSQGVTLPSSTVFEGDGVIIYTEDDYKIAIDFKKHLENDFPSLEIKVDLFDFIDMNMSLYASLESVLYKYRYVFIIITENLKKDKVQARANEDLQHYSFQEEWKSERIVPVFPDRKKYCPIMFSSLKGMQFYQSKSTEPYIKKLYEESVEKQIKRVREKSVKWEAIIKEHKGKGIQS